MIVNLLYVTNKHVFFIFGGAIGQLPLPVAGLLGDKHMLNIKVLEPGA